MGSVPQKRPNFLFVLADDLVSFHICWRANSVLYLLTRQMRLGIF